MFSPLRKHVPETQPCDAGVPVAPIVNALAGTLDAALGGTRPPTSPREHATRYDWEAITEQAETTYRRAIDGAW